MSAGADDKIHSIQLLRGLAALAVAIVHLTWAFALHLDGRIGETPWALQAGQTAVAAFFVISGTVMVVSSRALCGRRGSTLTFWRRRLVRVLPAYWIATAVLVTVALGIGLPVDAVFVIRSLIFVFGPHEVPFLPFLWPAWTLFFELLFYLVFGAFVFTGPARTVALTATVLAALVAIGANSGEGALLPAAITQPLMLLFVFGMAFGLMHERGVRLPVWPRIFAGLALIPGMMAVAGSAPQALGFDWLLWAGAPGLLAFLAVAGGPIPRRAHRIADTLGDLSYALYLLHVPFAHAWMHVFNVWLPAPGGSIGFLAVGIPLLLALSHGFHRRVERPLTRELNARLA